MSEIYSRLTNSNLRDHLTLHPIGGSALFLDSSRQRVFWLNPRAGYLWCCIDDELTYGQAVADFAHDYKLPDDEARTAVDRILAAIAALLDSDDAPAAPTEHAAPPPITGPDEAPGADLVQVALLGTRFDVSFPSTQLGDRFRSVMGHLERQGGPADEHVSVLQVGSAFAVRIGGEIVERCDRPSEVAAQVKAAVCHAAINRMGFDACLHAAAVRFGGGAALIPAGSGRGKSCLALTLAGSDYPCLSDDLCLFRIDGPTVQGVPVASGVKSSAWEAMAAIHPSLAERPVHRRIDGKDIKYLPLAEVGSSPQPVTAIIFPQFDAGAAPELTALTPEDALRELLASVLAWRMRLTPDAIDTIVAFVERTPCYRLHYGASADAVRIFDRLAGSVSAQLPA